jgi:hypothetical protein
MKSKYKQAFNLLIKLFFNSAINDSSEYIHREDIVQLLVKIAFHVDRATYKALTSQANGLSDFDLVRAIYLGNAALRPTIAEKVLKQKSSLSKKIATCQTIKKGKYFIQFYKYYSSYTPLLKSSAGLRLGGGYYLNLDGYGLVIDPGHDFLVNFYLGGRSFDDIDGILVTHFHDDHYADFPSLLALIFQASKISTAKKYDLFLDNATYDRFEIYFSGASNVRNKVRLNLEVNNKIRIRKNIILTPLPARHGIPGEESGVGVLVNIERQKIQLFITGDTGWCEGLGESYEYHSMEGWKKVLVAHVSSLNIQEAITLLKGKPKYYDKHLCINGLIRCIECLKPHGIILSEIGEELGGVIGEIAILIQSKYNSPCVVGIDGLKYDLIEQKEC